MSEQESTLDLIKSEDGKYKIGKSIDPTERLKDMLTISHAELTLVHVISTNDRNWLERLWHRKFAEKMIRREWFALTEEDVARFVRVDMWHFASPPVEGKIIDDPWYDVTQSVT